MLLSFQITFVRFFMLGAPALCNSLASVSPFSQTTWCWSSFMSRFFRSVALCERQSTQDAAEHENDTEHSREEVHLMA